MIVHRDNDAGDIRAKPGYPKAGQIIYVEPRWHPAVREPMFHCSCGRWFVTPGGIQECLVTNHWPRI
jgi:hypothetical protein